MSNTYKGLITWHLWLKTHMTVQETEKHGFDPCAKKIPWRRAWQPSLVGLTGESPWTEKPGGLQSIESQRVGHD